MLAILQAGGAGSRMDVLTRERAKPALPFASTFQLIDFALSAVMNAQIGDVWVSVQYQASSLDGYLAGGRPWDLDRTRGGFRRMVPEQGSGSATQDGFSRGNADGLSRLRDDIADLAPDIVVVLSCDSVMMPDLDALVTQHLEREAECTVLTSEVGPTEARQNVVITSDSSGRATGVESKPDRPSCGTVAVEVFAYDTAVLLEELERLRRELDSGARDDDKDTGLGDFGDYLLPRLVERGRTYVRELPGYWKDVGRPEAYLQAHRDLVRGRVDAFSDPARPVFTHPAPSLPALIDDGSTVQRSMIGPRSVIRGTVRDSVLGPGVVVEAGAVIEDSVLLSEVTVRAGAHVASAVIDTEVVIGRGATVGALHATGPLSREAIVLVGRQSTIDAGVTIAPGARLEPGTTA